MESVIQKVNCIDLDLSDLFFLAEVLASQTPYRQLDLQVQE